jgi:predicted alpha/beta-hydrolase family hydrolase
MPATAVVEVTTPEGPGRFQLAATDRPRALLVLGHGAGGGVDAVDLSVLASRLPAEGIAVARFEQPWRLAGKKVASPPPRLDIAWTAALPVLLEQFADDLPVITGGRSAGARVACRTAGQGPRVTGVVCCAFPLHPPGRPDRSRAEELLSAGVPRLVVQGERDPFGGPEEVRAVLPPGEPVTIVPVRGADHSMRTAKNGPTTPAEVRDLITRSVLDFVADRIADRSGR